MLLGHEFFYVADVGCSENLVVTSHNYRMSRIIISRIIIYFLYKYLFGERERESEREIFLLVFLQLCFSICPLFYLFSSWNSFFYLD